MRWTVVLLAVSLAGFGSTSSQAASKTFRDQLARAVEVPGARGSLLQRVFRACEKHESEFARQRCLERQETSRKEILGKVYCTLEPATLGTYDFRRKAFPVTAHPNLGDPVHRRDEPEEDDDEIRLELEKADRQTVIMVSGPGSIKSLGLIEDPKLNWTKWFPVERSEAEQFKIDGEFITVSVFKATSTWKRRVTTHFQSAFEKECKQMLRGYGVSTRKLRKNCAFGTDILGVKARLLGRAVLDRTSKRVLYTSPRKFGPIEGLDEALARCGSLSEPSD